jgi:hypothetical protein
MNAFFIHKEMRKERGCHVAAAPVQHRRPWGRRLRFGDGKEKAPRQGGASLTWLGNRPQISGADDSYRSERGRRGLASKKKPRRSGAKSKGTSRSKQATSGLYAVRRVSSNLLLRCKNISSVRRSSRKIAPPKRGEVLRIPPMAGDASGLLLPTSCRPRRRPAQAPKCRPSGRYGCTGPANTHFAGQPNVATQPPCLARAAASHFKAAGAAIRKKKAPRQGGAVRLEYRPMARRRAEHTPPAGCRLSP